MHKILVLEDDSTFAAILEGFLKKNGFTVEVRNSVRSALDAILKEDFHLLLLDYRLGDGIALDLLPQLEEHNRQLPPSIIMTSFHDVRTAVKAIRQGVYDYITKPINPDELLIVVREALANASDSSDGQGNQPAETTQKEKSKTSSGNRRSSSARRIFAPEDFVEGRSKAANKLQDYIALVAPTDMSVLIRGESGTGKEYVARSVHRLSNRADKPFMSIDCGTLSRELASSELFGHVKGSFTGALQDKVGQFEAASGGTLFLDEIGNLSYDVQVKLLRALQEGVIQPVGSTKEIKVDVRIIAATNEDLVGAQSENRFREDLYHRLNEFEIQVPALRDRREDFDDFVQFFIAKANEELGRTVESPSDEVMAVWEAYDWPGNLRELRNIIRRMVLLTKGTVSELDTLPEDMIHAVKNGHSHGRNSEVPVGGSPGNPATPGVPPASGNSAYPLTPPNPPNPPNPMNPVNPVTANTTGPGIVPPGGEIDLKLYNEQHERNLIIEVLNKTRYNKSKAAKLLNIDRKTLYNKMEKYDIF